jgi:hypothetical protein
MRKVYVGARRALATEEWHRLGWSEQHAERLASLAPSGIGPYVLIATPHGVEPLRHHVCHSPTGFEWGYTGNGPAELARCILIDHIGVKDGEGHELLVSYQAFKLDIIAKLQARTATPAHRSGSPLTCSSGSHSTPSLPKASAKRTSTSGSLTERRHGGGSGPSSSGLGAEASQAR